MRKLTKKSHLILYACSGLGVNLLNMILGSYLCSALLTGGFDAHIESWTYLNTDLVIPAIWSTLILLAKAVDGIIDIPLSHFTDNLKTKWGRRRPGLLIGFVPMMIAFFLFLIPITPTASVINTLWFAGLLLIYYAFYTLTMLTFYATFAEITEKASDVVLLSNVKSICDVVYFSLSFALVPLFVTSGINIRLVALIFAPLALTMMIPFFMIKEAPTDGSDSAVTVKRLSLKKSLGFAFLNKDFILWMSIVFIMNIGLQLFLGGINEFFSTANLNMTFVMASCFAPVPLTILLYNKITKKRGLGFGFRYILLVFSIAMGLMALCQGVVPQKFLFPFAILCGLIASFSIGSFFSITYTVPSHMAATHQGEGEAASSMYFAVQGLFEGISAGIATGPLLVLLKQQGLISGMTLLVAIFCMLAFVLTFLLPKSVTRIGLDKESK